MSPDDLVALIAALCINTGLPKDKAISCIEHYTNCMVGSGGVIKIESLNKCVEKYEK